MSFEIRPFRPGDLPALYRICLGTGDAGGDASHLFQDPELLGHFYAAPYAVFEPDLCFVVTHEGDPAGYVLGTRDTAVFHARCESEWFPPLRARYPPPPATDASPDARLIRAIHAGYPRYPELDAYPAHLHIDLLPVAQGMGWGRRLIGQFTTRLAKLGVPAFHLRVGTRNPGAIAFYRRIGLDQIATLPGQIAFGARIPQSLHEPDEHSPEQRGKPWTKS